MSNIEVSIMILKAFNLANIINIITQEEFEDVKRAISNVLADRERLKNQVDKMKNFLLKEKLMCKFLDEDKGNV